MKTLTALLLCWIAPFAAVAACKTRNPCKLLPPKLP